MAKAKAKDKERLSKGLPGGYQGATKKPYPRMSVGEAGSALGRKTARADRGQGLEARRRLEQHVESAISSKVAAEEKRWAGLTEAQKDTERKEYAQKSAPRRVASSAAQRRDRLSISPFPRPAGKPTVKPERRAEGIAPTPTGRPTVRVAGKTLARDQKKRRDFEAGHTIGRGIPGYGSSARRRNGDAEGHAGGAPGAQGQTPTKIKLTEKERVMARAGREAESASLARSGPGRQEALRYAMAKRMEERRGIHRPGEKPSATETELRRTSALGKLTYQEQLDKDRAAAKEARTKARAEKGAEFEETREKTLEKEKLEAEERVRKHQIETQAEEAKAARQPTKEPKSPEEMGPTELQNAIDAGDAEAIDYKNRRDKAKAKLDKLKADVKSGKITPGDAATQHYGKGVGGLIKRAAGELGEKWEGEPVFPGPESKKATTTPYKPKAFKETYPELTAGLEEVKHAFRWRKGQTLKEKARSTAWAKQKLSKEWKAAQESAKRHGKKALKTRGK